jgi:hypothetical protein
MNPLEAGDVIGISNAIDLGLHIAVPFASPGGAGGTGGAGDGGGGAATAVEADGGAGVTLAASWQVNKNVMAKARLSHASLAAALAMKSWLNPSLAAAAAVEWRFGEKSPRFGLHVSVENTGALRFERATEAELKGRGLTQRHEATDVDVQNLTGRRPLVSRRAGGGDEAVAEPAPLAFL